MEQSNIKDLLTDLSYVLTPDLKGWRTTANFRNGDNKTSILIYRDGSGFTDFVTNVNSSIETLIKLTLGLKTEEELKNWLANKQYNLSNPAPIETPRIKAQTIYPIDILKNLLEIHTYWVDRGISLETIKLFRGGIALKGRLKNRYVLPIFNKLGEIIGFTGRTTINATPTHKHVGGQTSQWAFPLYLNVRIVREKSEIILVEGVGDVLTLFECGIKNCAALFGTELKLGLLNALLRINPKKIIIATNYDQNNVGQEAAIKIETKLRKYFDFRSIETRLPFGAKDFNDMLKSENGKQKILNWYNKTQNYE